MPPKKKRKRKKKQSKEPKENDCRQWKQKRRVDGYTTNRFLLFHPFYVSFLFQFFFWQQQPIKRTILTISLSFCTCWVIKAIRQADDSRTCLAARFLILFSFVSRSIDRLRFPMFAHQYDLEAMRFKQLTSESRECQITASFRQKEGVFFVLFLFCFVSLLLCRVHKHPRDTRTANRLPTEVRDYYFECISNEFRATPDH